MLKYNVEYYNSRIPLIPRDTAVLCRYVDKISYFEIFFLGGERNFFQILSG